MSNKETIISDEIIIVSETDENGIITFANEEFCETSEYTFEELVGHTYDIVRHEDMPISAFKDLRATIESGKIWRGILKNKTKSGGFYWLNSIVYPSKTVDGKTKYISVRVKATQKEIENASNFYKTLK